MRKIGISKAFAIPMIAAVAVASAASINDSYENLSNVPFAGGDDYEFLGIDGTHVSEGSNAIHWSWEANTYSGTTADFPPIDKTTISSITCDVYCVPQTGSSGSLVFKLEPQDTDNIPNNHYQDEHPTVDNAFETYDTGAPGTGDLDLYGISLVPVGFGPTGPFEFWIDNITINFTDTSSVTFGWETPSVPARIWTHTDTTENAGSPLPVADGGELGDLGGPTPGGDKLLLPTGWTGPMPTPNDGNLMFGMVWEGESTDTGGTPGTVRFFHVFPITGIMSQDAPVAPDIILPDNLTTVDISDQSKVFLDINVPVDIGASVDVSVEVIDSAGNSFESAPVTIANDGTWNNDVEFDLANAVTSGSVDMSAVQEIGVIITGVPDTGLLFFDDMKTSGPAPNQALSAEKWSLYQ